MESGCGAAPQVALLPGRTHDRLATAGALCPCMFLLRPLLRKFGIAPPSTEVVKPLGEDHRVLREGVLTAECSLNLQGTTGPQLSICTEQVLPGRTPGATHLRLALSPSGKLLDCVQHLLSISCVPGTI